MMNLCDNCHTKPFAPRWINRDYISGEPFPLVTCQTCGLVRTRIPPDLDLSHYYPESYYGEGGKRFPAPIEWGIAQFRAARVRAILKFHPQAGSLLDVGCGRGLMLADFQRRGWSVQGTEFSPDLAAAVHQQYGFPVHIGDVEQINLAPTSLDVVTLWHVLEHLPHPIQTIQQIHGLLKPQGLLLIEVPNLSSWQAQIGRGAWFHLDAPRHLYHFSAEQLSQILAEAGFEVIHRQTLSLEYGFYGFIQTLLNRLTYQPNVLYARLKKTRPAPMGLAPWKLLYDDLITLSSLPMVGVAGIWGELAAIRAGQGGIIRLIARKSL